MIATSSAYLFVMTQRTQTRPRCSLCGQLLTPSDTNLAHFDLPPRFACMDVDCEKFGVFEVFDVD